MLLQKNPIPRMIGEWGWKDGWFSVAGLLAATEESFNELITR